MESAAGALQPIVVKHLRLSSAGVAVERLAASYLSSTVRTFAPWPLYQVENTQQVRKRTRAGMGWCQGQYCQPRVQAIIAKVRLPRRRRCAYTKRGGTSLRHSQGPVHHALHHHS